MIKALHIIIPKDHVRIMSDKNIQIRSDLIFILYFNFFKFHPSKTLLYMRAIVYLLPHFQYYHPQGTLTKQIQGSPVLAVLVTVLVRVSVNIYALHNTYLKYEDMFSEINLLILSQNKLKCVS